MTKSLLALLDESQQGQVASHLAVEIAARCGFSVTGLSILDTGAILHAESSALRSASDSDDPPVLGLDETRKQRHDLIQSFGQICAGAGLKHDIVEHEGEAYDFLDKASQSHDLIVMGKGSNFALHPETELEETVTTLLHKSSRPLVLAPVEDPKGEDIVVAYDGSRPAARALQMLVLLGMASGRTVHLISVASSAADAEETSSKAAAYLAAHDIRVERHNIADSGHPAEAVLARILDIKPSLLVMGAYGHRGWKEYLMGSSTIKLLNYATIPVFVHH